MSGVDAGWARDPFDALGDPNRREILRLLSHGAKAVTELAADMPISRPAVSRHLRLLKEANLVIEHAEGTRRIYRLHEQGLDAVRGYLDGLWSAASVRFSLLANNSPGEGGQ